MYKNFIKEAFNPKEGMLYKKITLSGKTFDLCYGYYEDIDRSNDILDIIYPDFIKNPVYTKDGLPYVTAMQDICKHFLKKSGEESCGDCVYYKKGEELLGLCTCPKNKSA